MCIFCAETVKTCAAVSEYISCFLRNVWLLRRVFQCFLRNASLLLKDISERLPLKENVQLIFFLCEAASRNISMFIIERAAASKKISMSDCF